jgi:hypothetical protein
MASDTDEKKNKLGQRFELSVLEVCSGGEPGAVRTFDSKSYLSIPFDQGYE